jgi:multisubunit Na+/H+ antiporter MnhF subunit
VAGVSPFLIAAIAMLLALALPGWVAVRATLAQRLVALELCSVVTALVLVCLSLAFGQPSFLDVAIALVVLSLPGTLVLTVCLERWL